MASDVDIGELVSRLGDCKEPVKPMIVRIAMVRINTFTSSDIQIISRMRSAIGLGVWKSEDS